MRSVYSDPVNAGLDSATKMLNILDTLEERPARQRLRELQVAKAEREELRKQAEDAAAAPMR